MSSSEAGSRSPTWAAGNSHGPRTGPSFSAATARWTIPPRSLGQAAADRVGAGLDPCAALQTTLSLRPDAETEIVFFLGEAATRAEALASITKYREADLDSALAAVTQYWDSLLGTVQVKTPDRSMDLLLNRWLLYQTLACRVWARSAFYQAGGAYGFRDQLQDVMALAVAQPALTREHLIRAASRQFVDGDVQHWWLPPSGQGVRTRISDDRVWLPYAVAHYIEVTGDAACSTKRSLSSTAPRCTPARRNRSFSRSSPSSAPLCSSIARARSTRVLRSASTDCR